MLPIYQVNIKTPGNSSATALLTPTPALGIHQYAKHDPDNTLLVDFENHLHRLNISTLIIRYCIAELLRFLQWFIQTVDEEVKVERITPSVIQRYEKHLLKVDDLGTSNRKMQKKALSIITNWAGSKQIQNKPSTHTKYYAVNRQNHKWLNQEQQTHLFHAIEKDVHLSKKRYPRRWITRQRDASLVIFMLQTGLRLTETVSLQNCDVHLSMHQGNVSIRHGKTSRHRVVPLNDKAYRTMQEWYTVRPQSKFIWTVANGKHDQALSGRAVQRILNRYAKAANINNLTPIVCRHTFARNLVSSGVRLEEAAALLGLSSLDAIRVYIPQSGSSTC